METKKWLIDKQNCLQNQPKTKDQADSHRNSQLQKPDVYLCSLLMYIRKEKKQEKRKPQWISEKTISTHQTIANKRGTGVEVQYFGGDSLL